jgi:hypothetical protein
MIFWSKSADGTKIFFTYLVFSTTWPEIVRMSLIYWIVMAIHVSRKELYLQLFAIAILLNGQRPRRKVDCSHPFPKEGKGWGTHYKRAPLSK